MSLSGLNYTLKSATEALCRFYAEFLEAFWPILSREIASELQLTHEEKHKHLPLKGTEHNSPSPSGLVMRTAKPPCFRNIEKEKREGTLKGTEHNSPSPSGLVMRAAKPPCSKNAESNPGTTSGFWTCVRVRRLVGK